MTELSQLNHRDMAVGLIKLDGKEVMISLYCDIKGDPAPDFLKTALDYGEKRGYSILIAADTKPTLEAQSLKILYKTTTYNFTTQAKISPLNVRPENLSSM